MQKRNRKKELPIVVSTRLSEAEYGELHELIKGRKGKRSSVVRYLIKKGLQEVHRLQAQLNHKKIG
jgi:metal-responsive CopG/Arc/MetJ family transcriptional regulator